MKLSPFQQPAKTAWRRSSFCAAGECVEVARRGALIFVRDSKDRRNLQRYTSSEWDAFVRGVKAGEFDDLDR